MPFRRAFTLVELLVVLALMVILAGLLFPVFAQAREHARAAACLSNARQIGAAYQMYAQDYDGALVPGLIDGPGLDPHANRSLWWDGLLQPYVHSDAVYRCPSMVPGPYPSYAVVMMGYSPESPALSPVSNLGWMGRMKTTSLAQAVRPADSVLAFENTAADSNPAAAFFTAWVADDYLDPTRYRWDDYYPGRHGKGHTVILVDGHARWRLMTTLRGRDLVLNDAPAPGWTGW